VFGRQPVLAARAGAAVLAGRRDRAGPRRQHKHRLHAAPVRAQGKMHDCHSKCWVLKARSCEKSPALLTQSVSSAHKLSQRREPGAPALSVSPAKASQRGPAAACAARLAAGGSAAAPGAAQAHQRDVGCAARGGRARRGAGRHGRLPDPHGGHAVRKDALDVLVRPAAPPQARHARPGQDPGAASSWQYAYV